MVTQLCPSQDVLDDLELIVSGALPGPLRLDSLDGLDGHDGAEELELVDPEGLPLARVTPAGEVTALNRPAHGPFRRLYLTPEEARSQHPGGFTAVLVGGVADRPAAIRAALATTPDVVAVPIAHGDPRLPEVLKVYGDPAVAEPVPAPDHGGVVVFFTGLSGSGKSTLARALMDRILEAGRRTLTSLDGDVVRNNLSKGLSFSKEDRETNIRRIGWVAAEIAHHGGVAVCSPIAPFDATRKEVRRMVEQAGARFVLVHVSTPLEECERRDRKGLYAKARRGEIPEFTGISSPYEVPEDAAVHVDTTGRTIEDALEDVIAVLPPSLVEPHSLVETGRAARGVEAPADAVPTGPLSVLFVCTANICRSPFMELTARAMAREAGAAIEFASAGTLGFEDQPMDEAMASQLDGLDAGGFRSRPLSNHLLEAADLVLTAEVTHRNRILEDHPAMFRKVFTLGQAAAAIERLENGAGGRALLARLSEARGSAEAAQDVRDPYRRGPEAAATAAGQIRALLDIVVPALVSH